MVTKYQDLFSSWKDVKENFNTEEKEPDEVLFAGYEYEDYYGRALVVYRNSDRYFWQEGSHCSCYGLGEGQWNPEEYNKKTLQEVLDRKLKSNYYYGYERKDILEYIKKKLLK